MAAMLETGTPAPAFDLQATTGNRVGLRDLAGQFAVIVFYPKNDTPG